METWKTLVIIIASGGHGQRPCWWDSEMLAKIIYIYINIYILGEDI